MLSWPLRSREPGAAGAASLATAPCSSRTCSGRSRSRESSAHTATPSCKAANSPCSPWPGSCHSESCPTSSPSQRLGESFAATRASIAESFAKAQAEPLRAPRLHWKLPTTATTAAGPLPPAEGTGSASLASPQHAGPLQAGGEAVFLEAPASLRPKSPRAIRTDQLPQAVSIVFPQPMLSHTQQPGCMLHPMPSQPSSSLGSPCVPARLVTSECQEAGNAMTELPISLSILMLRSARRASSTIRWQVALSWRLSTTAQQLVCPYRLHHAVLLTCREILLHQVSVLKQG